MSLIGMRKNQREIVKLMIMKGRLEVFRRKQTTQLKDRFGATMQQALRAKEAPIGMRWCEDCQQYHPDASPKELEKAILNSLGNMPGVKVEVVRGEDLTDEQAKAFGVNKPAKPTLN